MLESGRKNEPTGQQPCRIRPTNSSRLSRVTQRPRRAPYQRSGCDSLIAASHAAGARSICDPGYGRQTPAESAPAIATALDALGGLFLAGDKPQHAVLPLRRSLEFKTATKGAVVPSAHHAPGRRANRFPASARTHAVAVPCCRRFFATQYLSISMLAAWPSITMPVELACLAHFNF